MLFLVNLILFSKVSSTIQPQIPLISGVNPTNQVITQTQQIQIKNNKPNVPPNVSASQNYIPQNENNSLTNKPSTTTSTNNIILNNLLNQTGMSIASSTNGTTSALGSFEHQQIVLPGITHNSNCK